MDEPLPPFDRHYKLPTVAKLIDLSRPEVYALVKRGELRAILVGAKRGLRVSESEIRSFLERCRAKAGA